MEGKLPHTMREQRFSIVVNCNGFDFAAVLEHALIATMNPNKHSHNIVREIKRRQCDEHAPIFGKTIS